MWYWTDYRDIMYDITNVIRLSVMTDNYTVCYAWKNDILFYNDIWVFFYIALCRYAIAFINLSQCKKERLFCTVLYCFVLLIQYFKENVQIFIQVSKFKNWCKMVLVLSKIYTRHQLFLVFPVSHLSFFRHLASFVCPSYVVNFHLKIFSSETTEPHLAGMVF